jgi:hypothetical protein
VKGPQSIHTWASSLSLALSVQGSLAHSKLSIQSPPCQLGPGVLIPNAPRSSPLLRVGGPLWRGPSQNLPTSSQCCVGMKA